MKKDTIKVMKCKTTGLMVKMIYTGNLKSEDGKANGHKGWLCLHEFYKNRK